MTILTDTQTAQVHRHLLQQRLVPPNLFQPLPRIPTELVHPTRPHLLHQPLPQKTAKTHRMFRAQSEALVHLKRHDL